MTFVKLKKHDAKNRRAMYKLFSMFYPVTMGNIPSMTERIQQDLMNPSQHQHPQNWRAWLTLEIRPGTPMSEEDARALAAALAARLETTVKACSVDAIVDVLCLNEDPATGRALRIGKGELRGLQETAVKWLKEHGYLSRSVQETAAALAAEKSTLEADLDRLRNEATEARAATQTMQNAMQETHVAVGVYETALSEGKTRPRIPETALRQAREFAQSHAGRHPGMGLVSRLLQRQNALEILGATAIIAPAVLAGIVLSALAVTVHKAAKEQSGTVGAAPTPPAEKENEGRKGLEAMIAEMMSQVQEAIRTVETPNKRMDEVEKRLNDEIRESDATPVVMRVREGD